MSKSNLGKANLGNINLGGAGNGGLVVNVSESITATESVSTLLLPLSVNLADTVTVSESLSSRLSPLLSSVSDSTTVSDSLASQLVGTTLFASVSETVTASDAADGTTPSTYAGGFFDDRFFGPTYFDTGSGIQHYVYTDRFDYRGIASRKHKSFPRDWIAFVDLAETGAEPVEPLSWAPKNNWSENEVAERRRRAWSRQSASLWPEEEVPPPAPELSWQPVATDDHRVVAETIRKLAFERDWKAEVYEAAYVAETVPDPGYAFTDTHPYRATAEQAREQAFERSAVINEILGALITPAVPDVVEWLPMTLGPEVRVMARQSQVQRAVPNDISEGITVASWEFSEFKSGSELLTVRQRWYRRFGQWRTIIAPLIPQWPVGILIRFDAIAPAANAALRKAYTKRLAATTAAASGVLDSALSLTVAVTVTIVRGVVRLCAEIRGAILAPQPQLKVCEEVRGGYILPIPKVQCIEVRKDPDAVKDFWVDYEESLESGESIATSSWSADTGIIVDSDTWTGTRPTVWLSGGTYGLTYIVTNTITTSAGRTYVGELKVEVTRY